MNPLTNIPDQNQANTIEVGANPEQKEQFDKNRQEFEDKYEQKLKNILPENIFKKISGSFELNGNIDSTVNSLKDSGISEDSIALIKNFLNNDVTISKENLDKINNEITEFSNGKNLDMKLGDLIGKTVQMAEQNENDKIFDLAQKARQIQQNGTIEQKSSIIAELETNLGNDDLNKTFLQKDPEIQEKQQKQETQENIIPSPESSEEFVENDTGKVEIGDYESDSQLEESSLFGNTQEIENEKLDNSQATENVGNTEEKPESKQTTDYSSINGEFFPILENLKNDQSITNEQFEKINKDLASASGQEKTDKFLNSIEDIPNSESKENILKRFKKPEPVTEENFDKTAFSDDLKGKIDLDKSVGGLETMLAENYIYLPNKESGQEQNREKSLNTSMDVTLNKIINNKTNEFKQNNAELIGNIKQESNLNVKYQLLKKLYKNSLLEDAKYGGKKGAEELNHKKSALKERYKQILEEIAKTQKNSNQEEKNQKMQELQKDREKIEKEAKEIGDFEKELGNVEAEVSGLSGGKNDKLQQNNSIEKKE
ncbi:hypothetical protein BKN14_03925 [Candidatus Gracilibacteria bacterium HOT-871]|nr:hypothetical protein BKN14_03925 [Candidatus Gracilibacteria bacterium HOT-871]